MRVRLNALAAVSSIYGYAAPQSSKPGGPIFLCLLLGGNVAAVVAHVMNNT